MNFLQLKVKFVNDWKKLLVDLMINLGILVLGLIYIAIMIVITNEIF